MQTLQVLIVEGSPSFGAEFSLLVNEIGYEVTNIVADPVEALACIAEQTIDVILIDISLKGALEFAQNIQSFQTPIIFITSEDDLSFYEKTTQLNHIGFLVQPIKKLSLRSAIELSTKSKEYPIGDKRVNFISQDYFFVKKNRVVHKVPINKIIYFESAKNYCVVHLENKKFVLRTSLKKMEEQLSKYSFIRTHRSYLINMEKVDSLHISDNKMEVGGIILPFGNSYKERIMETIKPYEKK